MRSLKTFLPKNLTDSVAFLFLIAAVLGVFFYELLYVFPLVHTTAPISAYVHLGVGVFVLFNVLGNIFKLMTTETSIRGLFYPSNDTKSNWRFCATCESMAPPRSFHCAVCKTCILKRDHHCIFTGCCIGYRNMRYFIATLSHLSFGSLYAVALNCFYLWDLLNFSMLTSLKYFLPFLFFFSGQIDLASTIATMLSMLPLMAFLFVFCLLLIHLQMIAANQTTYENANRISAYDRGLWPNVTDTLGTRWSLVLLSPFVSSPQPGDGLSFPARRKRNPTTASFD